MNVPRLDLAGYRVAVVDDNRNFRDLLRVMLRAFGVRRVDCLAEVDEVIPFLCQNYVDLVFVDLVMPGMDGIQLAREIRHKPGIAKRGAPVVLVTGHASRATVVKAIAAGIDDIIVKPVSPQTILRRTTRLLLKPPHYVAGLDGYFGPDVAERRQSVERRLSADRWRLLKSQPYRFVGVPGMPSAKPGGIRVVSPGEVSPPAPNGIKPAATPVPAPEVDAGVALPGLSARAAVAKAIEKAGLAARAAPLKGVRPPALPRAAVAKPVPPPVMPAAKPDVHGNRP